MFSLLLWLAGIGLSLFGATGCGYLGVETIGNDSETSEGTASGTTEDSTDSSPPIGIDTDTSIDSDTTSVADSSSIETIGNDSETSEGTASGTTGDFSDSSSLVGIDTDTATESDTTSSADSVGDAGGDTATQTDSDTGGDTATQTDSDTGVDSDSTACPAGTILLDLSAFEIGQTGTNPSSWQYDGLLWTTGGLTGQYPSCESSYLLSPPIDLFACRDANRSVELVFENDYYFQEQILRGSVLSWPDGGIVQLSSDGTSWQSVDLGSGAQPISGDYSSCTDDILVNGESGFVGENSGWKTTVVQVEQTYWTSNFRVRFVFGSDGTSGAEPDFELGWFIRDVTVVVTEL